MLSSRPWNEGLPDRLNAVLERPVHTIGKPAELQLESLDALDPEWIFVPHWSHLIPEAIWSRWPTVISYMTDLPFDLYADARTASLIGDPPPRQRVGLRARRGWPDHHAANTSAPSTRGTAWSAG